MDREGLPDSSVAQSDPSLASIPNLKALLKESLTEVLRETLSLLKLPTETSPGEVFFTSTPPSTDCNGSVVGLADPSHLPVAGRVGQW